MAYRHNREISEEPYFDPHFQETGALRGIRNHLVGRRQFSDFAVSTSLRGFHFRSAGGPSARVVHIDGDGMTLQDIKAKLIEKGIRKSGDRLHEVQLAQGGGGVFVLLSTSPLRKDSIHNVDFDGQDD